MRRWDDRATVHGDAPGPMLRSWPSPTRPVRRLLRRRCSRVVLAIGRRGADRRPGSRPAPRRPGGGRARRLRPSPPGERHGAITDRAVATPARRRRAPSTRTTSPRASRSTAVRGRAAGPRTPKPRRARADTPAEGRGDRRRTGQLQRPQPRLDPGARDRPGRSPGSPARNSAYPGNRVYRWGCAGGNNVYLFGHASQRLQAAPRRVRPRPAAGRA